MSSLKLQPKNWQKFQHYKDRNPPWIKLHKDLLDDYDWWSLPVDSRALAPCLWLLASCYDDGIFDADTKILAFRFRMKESDVEKAIKPLIDKGYFNVASGLLADSNHDAMPETEERQRQSRDIFIVQRIVDLYHESMPENPRVKVITNARKSSIKARWNESKSLNTMPFGFQTTEQGLEAWRKFFVICNESKFLTGKVEPRNGYKRFYADIDWIMKPANFAKILENHYHAD